jgi:hypothetical protein
MVPHNQKPFKGVIANWWVEELSYGVEIVNGQCIWHADQVPLPAALLGPEDAIARGEMMHTSRVVQIKDCGTYKMLETKNSIYALIHPKPLS